MSKTICKEGQILIQTLNKVQKPTASINLFDTVPHKWVKNRELIRKAQEILRSLPEHYRYLLNAIFWEHTRFYRFLVVPYSLKNQYKFNNGLLRYTLHLVTTAIKLLKEESTVSRDLLTVAAFLQEAGKADKYTYKGQTKSFVLSSRGMLVDDAFTVLEWLTTAVERYQIELPTKDYINLVHAICADKSGHVPATHLISLNKEAKVISIAKKCTYIQHELTTMEIVSRNNIFQQTTIH